MQHIINPDSIKQENLVELFKESDLTTLDFFHNYVNKTCSQATQLNEAGNALSKASFTLHELDGVLYSVEDSVRQSIMGVDITNTRFDETLWMGKSILFNYEKSSDSWVMLQKVNKATYMDLAKKCNLKSVDALSMLCLHKMFAEDSLAKKHENIIVWKIFKDKKAIFSKSLKESKFGWFAGDATFSDIRDQYTTEESMHEDGNSHFCWIDGDSDNDDHTERLDTIGCLEQAFKVLAFASVPMLKPQSISKNKKLLKKLKREGSAIPNSGAMFRVVNLPHEVYEQQKKSFYAKGSKGLENGRAGGLVYYKHERYTTKRFTWGFRAPVPDKNGNLPKVAYKIKNPTKGSIPLDKVLQTI